MSMFEADLDAFGSGGVDERGVERDVPMQRQVRRPRATPCGTTAGGCSSGSLTA